MKFGQYSTSNPAALQGMLQDFLSKAIFFVLNIVIFVVLKIFNLVEYYAFCNLILPIMILYCYLFTNYYCYRIIDHFIDFIFFNTGFIIFYSIFIRIDYIFIIGELISLTTYTFITIKLHFEYKEEIDRKIQFEKIQKEREEIKKRNELAKKEEELLNKYAPKEYQEGGIFTTLDFKRLEKKSRYKNCRKDC